MGVFFVYMLKSSVCLAMFYLFYRMLLSKETFHRFNRTALLGVLLLSCLVPMIELTTAEASGLGQPFLELEEMVLMVRAEPEGVLTEMSSPFPWRALMLLVYVGGILFLVLRHLWSLGRMVRLLRASRRETLKGGITLFVHREKVAPFSWMNMIAVSEEDLEENRNAILTHERAHIKNGHSWDLLLAEVCIFLQWFNPAAWLLKQELQTIHEYEADEWVINNGIDAKTYQLLIIKKAVGARLYSIANSFNHSSLKKRITMMIKKKSNPWARLKYLYVLPLAAVAVAAFARPEVSNEFNEISSVKVNDLASIVKADEVKSVEKSSEEEFLLSGIVMEYPSHKVVAGASVIVRGTNNGTLTNEKGEFEIQVKKGDVLVVSFVGLQTQILPIKFDSSSGGNIKLGVHMKADVQNLEEVVVVAYAPEEEKKQPVAKEEVKQQEEEVIFQVVEQMPEFPGGMGEAMKFLAKNIKYPVAAQQAKIEGRVIVQFVVGKDGSISDVHTVRSVSPELDAEAIRVVSMMPKWNPGKQRGKAVSVSFTMPIMFRLQSPAPKTEEAEQQVDRQVSLKVDKGATQDNVDMVKNVIGNNQDVLLVRTADGMSPLIVVDGKELGRGANLLSNIHLEQIESVSVLKDKNAVAQYGEKAKDGVIMIVTKNNQQ